MNKFRSNIDILFLIFVTIFIFNIILIILCFKESGIKFFDNSKSSDYTDNHIIAGSLLNDEGKYCILYDDGRVEIITPKKK